MVPSVRAFLSSILDYAGLFPPAQLPLDEAIRNYARYRAEPEAWMLGRFICPAARLGELIPYVPELFSEGPPLRLSVLGAGGNDADTFWLDDDVRTASAFHREHHPRVIADAYEVRLPAAFGRPEEGKRRRELLAWTTRIVEESGPNALSVYYEIPAGVDWRSAVAVLTACLREANEQIAPNGPPDFWGVPVGLKIRCGGLNAAAFPSPSALACALAACSAAEVPWKATAGLHHPVRRHDTLLQTAMHGFLNVFGAGILAHAHHLSEEELLPILEEEDPAAFRLDVHSFRWRDLAVTTDAIASARRTSVLSFGSCSFDEPRDDLRALGLLP
jgi:hypothetical protein